MKPSSTSSRGDLAPDAITCPVCGQQMNVITSGHYRKHGFETAVAFKRAFALETLKARSLCRRHSDLMSESNPMKGRVRSDQERRLISDRRKGKGLGVAGKYERTPTIRARIADGVAAHHHRQEGTFTRGEKVYSRKAGRDVFLRSSWEKRVLAILEASPYVEVLDVEPCIIHYEHGGRTRRYVPDFAVRLEGGVWEVWEVKPAWARKLPINQAKFTALNSWATARGWNTRFIDLPDILGMEQHYGLFPVLVREADG